MNSSSLASTINVSSAACAQTFWQSKAVPGTFLGLVDHDHSDSKSSRFCFHSFEVYSSIDSSNMIGNSPEVSNFNQWLFLKLNRFICN